MSGEVDYVLGTHDEEVARLGVQHRAWRPFVLDAWRRAGFAPGQTLIDVGCGPGYASLDLAEIVGPSGHIVSVDRSRRFLDVLDGASQQRGLDRIISTHELDLDSGALPVTGADGAWARWVFAFVQQPCDLLERLHAALRPGATVVIFEYFDYATWRTLPRSPVLEEFVRDVMTSWRASGGEPDIALSLPTWLEEIGFHSLQLQPIVEILNSRDPMWLWPRTFINSGSQRLADLGEITEERARAIVQAFNTLESSPHARMITPGVMRIHARKRD